MKKTLLFLAFTSLVIFVHAQENILKFEEFKSWEDAKLKAKTQNKFIFIDVFATWCSSCKWMEKNTFTSPYLASYMKAKYISIKLQLDSTAHDTEYTRNWYKQVKLIKDKYNITVLPTFLFFDQNGRVVHKSTGAVSDSTLVNIASNSTNSEKQYYTLLALYRSKKLSLEKIPFLVRLSNYAGEAPMGKIIAKSYIDDYLLKLPDVKLFTKNNIEFIRDNIGNAESKSFKLFFDRKVKINEVLGEDKAEYIIRSVIAKDYISFDKDLKNPQNYWRMLENKLTNRFGNLGQETIYGQLMNHYLSTKDWSSFGKYYKLYFEKALKRPEYNINAVTWPLFENVNDPEVLNFACDIVMKYAIEEWYSNYANAFDTYANLLYKTNRKEKAIEWEERAVKLKRGVSDEETYIKTLEKMRNNIKTWPDTVTKL